MSNPIFVTLTNHHNTSIDKRISRHRRTKKINTNTKTSQPSTVARFFLRQTHQSSFSLSRSCSLSFNEICYHIRTATQYREASEVFLRCHPFITMQPSRAHPSEQQWLRSTSSGNLLSLGGKSRRRRRKKTHYWTERPTDFRRAMMINETYSF